MFDLFSGSREKSWGVEKFSTRGSKSKYLIHFFFDFVEVAKSYKKSLYGNAIKYCQKFIQVGRRDMSASILY